MLGLEQYAIKSFGEALEVVPSTLAENCGVKSREVVSNLYSAHEAGKSTVGYDVTTESAAVADMKEKGVFDSFYAKKWALKYAVQAANTILRVDQVCVVLCCVVLCVQQPMNGSQQALSCGVVLRGCLGFLSLSLFHTCCRVSVFSPLQIIMAKKAGGPKPPKSNPNWDED